MSRGRHGTVIILYPVDLEIIQSQLEVVVHALRFEVFPYTRQCDIVALIYSAIGDGMLVKDLYLATLLGNPSINPVWQ